MVKKMHNLSSCAPVGGGNGIWLPFRFFGASVQKCCPELLFLLRSGIRGNPNADDGFSVWKPNKSYSSKERCHMWQRVSDQERIAEKESCALLLAQADGSDNRGSRYHRAGSGVRRTCKQRRTGKSIVQAGKQAGTQVFVKVSEVKGPAVMLPFSPFSEADKFPARRSACGFSILVPTARPPAWRRARYWWSHPG